LPTSKSDHSAFILFEQKFTTVLRQMNLRDGAQDLAFLVAGGENPDLSTRISPAEETGPTDPERSWRPCRPRRHCTMNNQGRDGLLWAGTTRGSSSPPMTTFSPLGLHHHRDLMAISLSAVSLYVLDWMNSM